MPRPVRGTGSLRGPGRSEDRRIRDGGPAASRLAVSEPVRGWGRPAVEAGGGTGPWDVGRPFGAEMRPGRRFTGAKPVRCGGRSGAETRPVPRPAQPRGHCCAKPGPSPRPVRGRDSIRCQGLPNAGVVPVPRPSGVGPVRGRDPRGVEADPWSSPALGRPEPTVKAGPRSSPAHSPGLCRARVAPARSQAGRISRSSLAARFR